MERNVSLHIVPRENNQNIYNQNFSYRRIEKMVRHVKKIIPIIMVVLFVGMALLVFNNTQQQQKHDLNGHVRVKHPPNITAIELFDDEDGGTTTPTTELTPFDEMTIRVAVDLVDPAEIYSVDVYIYHSLVGLSAPDNASHHATIHWDKDTGTWTISAGASVTWAVDGVNSSVPLGLQGPGTIYIFVVFTPGKITRYSNVGNWVIGVNVTDADNPNLIYDYDELTGLDCRFYLETSVDASAFDFGTVAQGCTNVSFNYTGGINISVIVNYWWYLKLNATGWYNDSRMYPENLTVNFTEFNSLLADDDDSATEAAETGLSPFWVRPTYPSGIPWDHLSPPDNDNTGTVIHLYLFVSLPSDIPFGDYYTLLSIVIAQSTP